MMCEGLLADFIFSCNLELGTQNSELRTRNWELRTRNLSTMRCLLFLFMLASVSFASGGSLQAQGKPNILVILTDDQGYHDVSYYGTKDIRTPNIDALTRGGMRFDNFYANSPVCSPTRAALLTGMYPDEVGVPGVIRTHADDSWGYLNPDAILLPALLKTAGYRTALIGKWHLGLEQPNTPNDRGFDYFHGWLGDMMDDYNTHRRHNINYMRENTDVIDPGGHATDLFTEWSVNYLRERSKIDQPFFLYLAYNAPHSPVQPPAAWVAKVKARSPGIEEKRAALVAFIEHMDDGIGKVVDALKETGQYENTLIVFTSDNGGDMNSRPDNGPLRSGKGTMYEGGIRVPASFHWPARIKPGTVSEQVNLSMDLFPTLLEAAGATNNQRLSGRSFFKTLVTGRHDPEDRPIYFVRREGNPEFGGQCIYGLRLGDWKLLQNRPYQGMELYNLREDPLEKNNVILEQREVYARLHKLLMRQIQRGGRSAWQPEAAPQN